MLLEVLVSASFIAPKICTYIQYICIYICQACIACFVYLKKKKNQRKSFTSWRKPLWAKAEPCRLKVFEFMHATLSLENSVLRIQLNQRLMFLLVPHENFVSNFLFAPFQDF